MENYIIVGILVVITLIAILRVRKNAKGGCCGSGGNTIRDKKRLTETKLGEKTLHIEGMHCENCEIRLENALNRLPGLAARVSCRKKTAVIAYSREISDTDLKSVVEKMGYKITAIQ